MEELIDIREQLYNEGQTGLVHRIQLPQDRITRLNGILFDLDPKLLVPRNIYFPPAEDPKAFYHGIRPVLDRHPLASKAAVRISGTGLHVIVWIQPGVELHSAEEQDRWAAIVKVVQCSLPSDPDAPGITALTRAVGSVNGKNGARVEVLKPAEPVSPAQVELFVEHLRTAPFRTIANILFGTNRVQPCPVCEDRQRRLDVANQTGSCYGGCSTVTLDQLYDVILRPIEGSGDEEEACNCVVTTI